MAVSMASTSAGTTERAIRIKGMDCADCAATLARGVGRLPGVAQCSVNFAAARMAVVGDAPSEAIYERIRELGYDVDLSPENSAASDKADPHQPPGGIRGFAGFLLARPSTTAALVGGLGLIGGFIAQVANAPLALSTSLFVAALIVAGWPVARSGLRAAVISREITINLLMTIAALGALLIGEVGEGAMTVCLFAIGEALQGYTTDRARRSIRSLMQLAPAQATVLRPCMDCHEHFGRDGYTGGPCPWCGVEEHLVPLAALNIGERILIKSGERIPMDGVVRAGQSSVDQSPLTGESLPVVKAPGNDVFAGTLNGETALEIEVTRLAADSTLNRVIRLVEDAQANKAPTQTRIDRFASVYTPAVVIGAALLAIIPPLVFHAPLWDANGAHGWFYRALSLLVIACPCALVISTPVSIIGAITSAARHGILIKGGAALEGLGRVHVFAFDKTGTLTRGKPDVQQTVTPACSGTENHCSQCDDMLMLAASVERRASHPLAQAVVTAAAERGLLERLPAAENVTILAGQGVQGTIGGRTVTIGSHRYFETAYPHPAGLCQQVEQAEAQGYTAMLVHDGQQVRGYITVSDSARTDSKSAVGELRRMPGVSKVVMLTGDSPATAARIAQALGIDEVESGLLPEDKLAAIRRLAVSDGSVAMIGDGINDTPALAAASVGIAMGGAGSAQALETADVALMGDDLSQLPYAVALSQATERVISQNVTLSLVIKALFLVLALFGAASLWAAVLADVGTSLVVTSNGMRLLAFERRV